MTDWLGAKKAYFFTSKLVVGIRSHAQQGEKELEIIYLIASLPSTVKQPTHSVKAGIGSIVLLIAPGRMVTAQSQTRPGIWSTFTIHTMPSFNPEDEVKGIVNWIPSFLNTRRMSLQYKGAKRVNLTFIFILYGVQPAFESILSRRRIRAHSKRVAAASGAND